LLLWRDLRWNIVPSWISADLPTLRVVASLFGRDSELAEARACLSRALSGDGATVLLAGEPGIGKSRLADELAALAVAEGASVHWGRGWEGGGAPAYWPWTEALTSLAAGLDTSHLAALVGEDAPEMVRLVPGLRSRLAHLEAALLPDADEGRFRLASAIAATLKRAAAVKARVIILDDLHMADSASLSCLQLVARSLRGLRVLLVGTYRDAEVRLSPQLSEKIGVLARDAVTIPLGALDRQASLALIQDRSNLAGDVAGAIAEATGGNPLFLNEMSRLVASRGTGPSPAQALPLGIQESIRQRLALLPAEAVHVLETAACGGREIDAAVTAQALGLPLTDVLTQLDMASRAGMVIEREPGQRAFSHDLIREVLYRALPREQRITTHQKLAAALTGLGRNSVDAASAIANHLLEAAEVAPEPAIHAALEAARVALDVVAYEHALSLLARAQAVVERGGVDRQLVAKVLIELGEARLRSGQVALAKTACEDAMAIARSLGDAELMASAALTWGSEIQPGTIDGDLVRWLQEARASLKDGNLSIKARVLGRLAAALQPAQRPQEPVAMAREAIALARETGDDRTLLEVIHSSMAAMMEYVDPRERLPLNLEQEALAQRFHDRPRELRARLRLYFDYFVIGDFSLAEARAQSFAALAAQLRQARFAWFLPSWKAARATYEGRFSEVPALLDEAAAASPPGPMGQLRDALQRMELARTREDFDALRAAHLKLTMREWQRMEMGGLLYESLIAMDCVRLGEPDQAQRLLSSMYPGWGGVDTLDAVFSIDPYSVSVLGELFIERQEIAERAYQYLLPSAGQQATLGFIGMTWNGPIDRMLGVLAGAAGQRDRAVEHFEAAIDGLVRNNGRGLLARTWLEAAQVRLDRGAQGDREAAQRYAASGRALAAELGQRDLLAWFEKRLAIEPMVAASVGVPSPRASATIALMREGDYWAVHGAGASFRLKDSRGLQMLARLIARPDQEVHCLELASDGPRQEVDGGDSGELLDADAKRQYRARVEDLQEELREAEQFGDAHRASRATQELEFLAGELSRAVGLGGRSRKGSSATERARVAVQRRVKDAISRIAEHEAQLGRHLEWAVKTGTYCCYRPWR
jgi:tetratricopeptide (TPR) repeat protein